MTKLSVNINKIATLRNARGGNTPNVVQVAKDVQLFGAQGVTIHPRPDERHITYQDTYDLKNVVSTEYNIEGNPNAKFVDMVLSVKPTQVTLVPDSVAAITSNAGWDTIKYRDFLRDVISQFKESGIRTSIFVNPEISMVEGAVATGADRIELYTEEFANQYALGNFNAVKSYTECALRASEFGLGINAGHDLSLNNIKFFNQNMPKLAEVSIGHALISEALYFGLETTVKRYLELLKE
jgi:pyridoxine 5-phosphate synthase